MNPEYLESVVGILLSVQKGFSEKYPNIDQQVAEFAALLFVTMAANGVKDSSFTDCINTTLEVLNYRNGVLND